MPQVFGESELGLMSMASLFVEAASEAEIERATHPAVAAEARARGLVPKRLGKDPIWEHPESGMILGLPGVHTGDASNRTAINNSIAAMRRKFPTEEETARAARTPEQMDVERANAAEATRSKKQQAVDAARRERQRQEATRFKQLGLAPFKNMDEVREAHGRRSPSASPMSVDDFAAALSKAPQQRRQELHQSLFPERY